MWEYQDAARLMTIRCIGTTECIYCQYPMQRLPAEEFEIPGKRLLIQLSICSHCGWWSTYRVHQGEYPRTRGIIESYSATIGCLKELDLNDLSVPLDEVRQYLLARKESVFDAHPKLFEDVVCNIFEDLGWRARVTAYSGDDGIDIILDGCEGETIGVQVKRYKQDRRIEAEQIRSLAGALLVNGHTKGIFVTTSSFRSGAKKTADKLKAIGYPIDLVDAERFLEALGIAQTRSFRLDGESYLSYVTSLGVHLGSGMERRFQPGEDLSERPVAACAWLGEEFIDMYNIG